MTVGGNTIGKVKIESTKLHNGERQRDNKKATPIPRIEANSVAQPATFNDNSNGTQRPVIINSL